MRDIEGAGAGGLGSIGVAVAIDIGFAGDAVVGEGEVIEIDCRAIAKGAEAWAKEGDGAQDGDRAFEAGDRGQYSGSVGQGQYRLI